jgi:serine/threonine protein phosphatase PrpC
MIVTQFTHASIEHPERNEDAVMVFAGDFDSAAVFAVIDGMGGHQHTDDSGRILTGQDAAQIVREVLVEDLLNLPFDVSADVGGLAQQKVTAALERANQRILRELNSGDLPTNQRVGAVATVAVVCEQGARLFIGQVGDTRAYLFSEGDLFQLCEDADNISYMIEQGSLNIVDGQRITAILNTFDGINEPKTSGQIKIAGQPYELYLAWRWFLNGNSALGIPGGNTVMTALGIHPALPAVQVSRIEVTNGDKLFLCSDGIYKNLSEVEIMHFLHGVDSAKASGLAALERSHDEFNRRSTADDISAVCVEF